ncbi:MAG: glycoside hydrolase family 2 protein, partial [Acidimicrobiales bacterium]
MAARPVRRVHSTTLTAHVGGPLGTVALLHEIPNLTESHLLNSSWRATPSTELLRRNFGEPSLDDRDWTPVEIPHQWAGSDEFNEQQSVLYRTRFSEPPRNPADPAGLRTWICLDGVMTSADVWLNGSYLGLAEGYSIPHAFDITAASHASSEHMLAIDASCPNLSEGPRQALTGIFQGGQAFPPDANPGGIWRSVRLERTGSVRIDRLRVICREADSDRAILGIHVRLLADGANKVLIRTFLDPAADKRGQGRTISHIQEVEVADGDNLLDWRFAVEQPELWWPHALGDQPLYDLRVEVVVDGQISHVRKRRTGLRQIEMSNWQMHVNGERLFLKGANLLPAALDLGCVALDDLLEDLHQAKAAGLDFLRVHSHINRPELYREADRIGLLLWQDLPITGEMHRAVRKRAEVLALETVDLLGHHPSIAIWCTHNDPKPAPLEDFVTRESKQRKRSRRRQVRRQGLPSWNRSVLDRGLKRAMHKADPSRLVVASSGVLPHPPQMDGTDAHLWLGWYYGEAEDIAQVANRWPRAVRFVSEF